MDLFHKDFYEERITALGYKTLLNVEYRQHWKSQHGVILAFKNDEWELDEFKKINYDDN